MEVLFPACCGLDVHKKRVVACRLLPGEAGSPVKEVRSFATMTGDLLALADWLAEGGVTHVAMESTGSYWKPIYNLLEEQFELWVVNAAHIQAVPGRKTDVKDAEWIATLLRHGLLSPSFIPPRPRRELRELTRYRTCLVRERAAEVNRLQKTLEGANLKLACVVSDLTGRSARQILRSLVAGETEAAQLAQLAQGRLREKLPQLEASLMGSFGAHQRFLVAQQLAHIEDLEKSLAAVSAEVTRRLSETPEPGDRGPGAREEAPSPEEAGTNEGNAATSEAAEAMGRWREIPGVGQRTAETLIAELGTQMNQFPSAGHAASWAGMTPGHHESAGKKTSSRTRKGSPWLRGALVEAAHAAGRTKETYLGAKYRQLAARRGRKRAAMAVGRLILEAAYHLQKHRVHYQELGASALSERNRDAVERRLVQKLERLGNKVTVERLAVA